MKRSSLRPRNTSALALRSPSLQGAFIPQSLDQFASLIGGKQSFIDMARCSQSPSVKAFVQQWDSISPEEQDSASVDDLCQRAGLDPNQLTQEAVCSFSAMQSMIAQLKLAIALPSVMDASIRAALRPEGGRERELHFMRAGLVERTEQIRIG
jgi:hypothetical protein